jgi:hypothetical protein
MRPHKRWDCNLSYVSVGADGTAGQERRRSSVNPLRCKVLVKDQVRHNSLIETTAIATRQGLSLLLVQSIVALELTQAVQLRSLCCNNRCNCSPAMPFSLQRASCHFVGHSEVLFS